MQEYLVSCCEKLIRRGIEVLNLDPRKGHALGLAQRFFDGVHDPTYTKDKQRTLLAQAGICLIIAKALTQGLFTNKARGREEDQKPLDANLFKEAEGILLKRMDHVGHILHLKTQDEPISRAVDELAKGLESIQFDDMDHDDAEELNPDTKNNYAKAIATGLVTPNIDFDKGGFANAREMGVAVEALKAELANDRKINFDATVVKDSVKAPLRYMMGYLCSKDFNEKALLLDRTGVSSLLSMVTGQSVDAHDAETLCPNLKVIMDPELFLLLCIAIVLKQPTHFTRKFGINEAKELLEGNAENSPIYTWHVLGAPTRDPKGKRPRVQDERVPEEEGRRNKRVRRAERDPPARAEHINPWSNGYHPQPRGQGEREIREIPYEPRNGKGGRRGGRGRKPFRYQGRGRGGGRRGAGRNYDR